MATVFFSLFIAGLVAGAGGAWAVIRWDAKKFGAWPDHGDYVGGMFIGAVNGGVIVAGTFFMLGGTLE